MSAIEPKKTWSGGITPGRRQWRRWQIVATYVTYAVLFATESIRAHVALAGSARTLLFLVFSLAAVGFLASLLWLVSPSVGYGLARVSYRPLHVRDLRALKATGVSARQAAAVLRRPPDEQQLAIREHARAVSYVILGPIIMVVAIYLALATQLFSNAWMPTSGLERVTLVSAFALLYSTLPAAVVAWREPDPVPEDDQS